MTVSRPGGAIVMMLLAMSLIPLSDAASKQLTDSYPPIQIAWMRYGVHVAVIAPLAIFWHGRATFFPPAPWLQLGRGLCLASSSVFFVAALSKMPIADAMATIFVFPFIVTALSPWLLGERVGVRRWAAVAVGFGGALLVIDPGASLAGSGVLFALTAAVTYSGYVILTRLLSGRSPPLMMLLSVGVVGVISIGVAVPFQWTPLNLKDAPLFLAGGAITAMVHLLVIVAYRWGEASLVAPFSYFQIVGGVILGWAVFGDFPEAHVWAGVAVVIASGLYIAWRERTVVKPSHDPVRRGAIR